MPQAPLPGEADINSYSQLQPPGGGLYTGGIGGDWRFQPNPISADPWNVQGGQGASLDWNAIMALLNRLNPISPASASELSIGPPNPASLSGGAWLTGAGQPFGGRQAIVPRASAPAPAPAPAPIVSGGYGGGSPTEQATNAWGWPYGGVPWLSGGGSYRGSGPDASQPTAVPSPAEKPSATKTPKKAAPGPLSGEYQARAGVSAGARNPVWIRANGAA